MVRFHVSLQKHSNKFGNLESFTYLYGMRKCSVCKEEKELGEFHKKGSGHAYMCKECRKKYIRKHYLENKPSYLKKAKESQEKIRVWYQDLKSTLKCKSCGENHISCLEFHHLDPNKKEINISEAALISKKRVEEELKKCIVLCSNCHRKLHYKLKQK